MRLGLVGCGAAGRVPRPTRAAVSNGPAQTTTPAASAASSASSGKLDPRFPFCTSAIAAGYGPYVKGVDPAYAWYRDGDGDGIVCER